MSLGYHDMACLLINLRPPLATAEGLPGALELAAAGP